ncbi:MAG: DNA polymerase/3'-5' exonuclease PolX [Candidatus Daviesbacteria bacterium]|nr:MAG: DNA polymerase/3'-5' exonuclease PolX [Candidatus Daviesbacteria bacterium]
MQLNNLQVAKLLREVAAALTLKKTGNVFEIRAFENAASSIEHSTSEVRDLWEEGRLDEIPGLGEKLKSYLEELFKTGQVKHFTSVKVGLPDVVFELLDVPGIGPKTAQEIAKLGVKNLNDFQNQIKSGELVKKGFSAKIAERALSGLQKNSIKEGRMLLPYAFAQAQKILLYLKKSEFVNEAYPLGSLRRMVATVGDLDFSVSSKNPVKVVNYFCKMPGVSQVLEKGDNKATVVLKSGLQVDLLVGSPESYGALLQHFTGSKDHNIHLRTLAVGKSLSLSEYGIKKASSGELIHTRTEEELYKLLGMQTPDPEIREDTGEIEAALKHKLPDLVQLKDLKGDLHLHSNYPIKSPSHGPGANSIAEMVKKARELGYHFVGISDHPPGFSTTSREEMFNWVQKRTKFIQNLKQNTKSIQVLNGLEVDIQGDGSLSVPDEALKLLDYCIAGIHSSHGGTKETITNRILQALENPYVDILAHPTNRLLNERGASEADWEKIFKFCAKNNKLLEINAFPNRLDLRDDLVREALKYGVKFIINTDAHEVSQMDNMKFGVAVARRGWAEAKDVVNTWDWTDFAKWFKI